jgi:outer membrane biosynthesis protein TonB
VAETAASTDDPRDDTEGSLLYFAPLDMSLLRGRRAMPPRSERQKILWAIFLSLLLHLVVGVSIASFGDKLQPRLPEEEKPVELTIVDVASAASATIPPKNMPFIDTPDAKATTEQPKEQAFESNANSIGASELPALGNAPIPTQEGKELPTHDLESHPYSLDQQGAPTQLNSRPSPVPTATPQATPKPAATETPAVSPSTPQPTSTPQATPTPAADMLAMFRATPPPTTQTPGQKNNTSATSRKTTPSPRPAPSTAYRREQIPERMAGNISKRGVSSVNAVGTPLGRYEQSVYSAIGARWYKLCDENRDRVDIGTVSVQFMVAPDGKIGNIKVISGGTSASFTNLCLQSVQDAKPEPIPEDVVAVLPPEGLPGEVNFTGYTR